MFTYGIAWGINQGILDKKEYLPVLLKAWNGMVENSVHSNGFLGYSQSTGSSPTGGTAYDSVPDYEDFGVGCFLLAGSEIYKLK
jgi:rhamnogalacturonyl hydrolase YesR